MVGYPDDDPAVEGEPFATEAKQRQRGRLVFEGARERDDVNAATLHGVEAVDGSALDAATAPAIEREVCQMGEVFRNLDADRFETACHASRRTSAMASM